MIIKKKFKFIFFLFRLIKSFLIKFFNYSMQSKPNLFDTISSSRDLPYSFLPRTADWFSPYSDKQEWKSDHFLNKTNFKSIIIIILPKFCCFAFSTFLQVKIKVGREILISSLRANLWDVTFHSAPSICMPLIRKLSFPTSFFSS